MKPHDTNKTYFYLEKLCADDLFAKSLVSVRILRYLVEQALAGNDLKEQTIGMELFEENYNADKTDGSVRVYMYKIRKKLDTYYSDKGKNDELVFSLNKGSYNLRIELNAKVDLKELQPKFGLLKQKALAMLAIALLVVLSALGLFRLFHTEDVYCWSSFFETDADNLCILADQVILHAGTANNGILVTKTEINSPSEFIDYTESHPNDTLFLSGFTMFTKAIPYSLLDLSKWFLNHNADFIPRNESQFKYEESKRANLLYIGQYKTMSVSKEIFLRDSKVFQANLNYFTSTKNGEEKLYKSKFEESLKAEYAMVSYVPIQNGNKALYFVSNHDIGTMATVSKFTNSEFLTEFYAQLPSKESYFNALFLVEGVKRTDMSCELVELEVVEK